MVFGKMVFGKMVFGKMVFGKMVFGKMVFGKTALCNRISYQTKSTYLGKKELPILAGCLLFIC